MTPEKAIRILERKTTIPGDGFTYLEIMEAVDFAIREVGKAIPKAPVMKAWEPNHCPTCDADLGGDCDDGYYQNPWYERCPECGQRLSYE